MSFEALDSTKLIILMVAGAAFAAVGLYLMLKPRSAGAAKIELFGLKFESSSAGLLVFLIGAAFMAIPLFAPEKPSGGSAKSAGASNSTQPAEVVGDGTEQAALLLPAEPDVEEVEPNNRLREANQLAFGSVVSGYVERGEADWFVIPLPEDVSPIVTMKLRRTRGSLSVLAVPYDHQEVAQNELVVHDGSEYRDVKTRGGDRIYVKVRCRTCGEVWYELSLTSENPS